jgi:Gpi18-like mannosyltransferase
MINPKQVNLDAELWMGASTLYYYIPNTYYRLGMLVGMAVTLAATVGYVWVGVRSKVPFSRELMLIAAAASTALLPELMPKMHDRYFFPADVLSIVLAFYVPRLWFLAPLFQVVSLTGYSWFLLNRPIIPMPLAVAAGLIATGTLVAVYVAGFWPVESPSTGSPHRTRDFAGQVPST